ncbi:hypothetical protein ACET3Z_031991 [Daucus carota]
MPPQIISDISTTAKPKYAKLGYQFLANHLVALISVPILLIPFIQVIHLDPFQISCFSILLIFLSALCNKSKSRPIYLVDFACYRAPDELRASSDTFSKIISKSEPESLKFQHKVLERTGLGKETCLPPALHLIPPDPTLEASRQEAETVIFSAMDSLLLKSGLNPKDIDILVVNSTVWCSIPSLSSMVINKYKMKDSVKSFNISGMGCSGSLISISLVCDLLQVHPNYKAVVISAEIITTSYYQGKERSMLVPNCLFRMGGAAIFLSTRKTFGNIRAKYRLLHLIRTHTSDDDKSYNCVYMKEDPEGILGVWLSKELMAVAGKGLKLNLTALGPLVLPASEKIKYFINFIARKIFKHRRRPYVPDFKQAFEHFCIHAGGRAVIDGVQESLQLSMEQAEASRSTLHRFGNTSSSSLWYEMSYIEAKGRMKKGDRILQISFGSGYKCNSAVWECTETVETPTGEPWMDCIDKYPACIPQLIKSAD